MTNRPKRGDPDGNPHIEGSHPRCEECGSPVVVNYTNYGMWYQCRNCGNTETHGSVEQVGEL